VCIALLLATAGCSDSKLAPVTGRVLVDGTPLTVGRIQFAPKATDDTVTPGKPAKGRFADDGSFSLTIGDQDGAVVGEHRVTIFSKSKKLNGGPIPPFDVLRLIDRQFTVQPNSENDFQIELTADYVRKFGEVDD
jgi:hypothetical protein